MNFAIYSEYPDTRAKNTEGIREITREHACRAMLIAGPPCDSRTGVLGSRRTANCTSRAGSKTVCCEQITFLLEGDMCSR